MKYPYPTDQLHRLHPDSWHDLPVVELSARALVPTQPLLSIKRLLHHVNDGEPEAGDPCAHVVVFEGHRYVHDGHHRWALAYIRDELLACRVVEEAGS